MVTETTKIYSSLTEEGLKKGYLKSKKVYLKPIEGKRMTLIAQSDNSVHSFMYDGATYDRCLPLNARGDFYNPFDSDDEKDFFERLTGKELRADSSNPKCVWVTGADGGTGMNITIKVKFNVDTTIKTQGFEFDLMNPNDVLRLKIAKMQWDTAPSWENRHDKPHYVWAIVDGQEEDLTKKKLALTSTRAYIEFGKIQDNKDKMIEVLKLYYMNSNLNKDVSNDISSNALITEIQNIIEKNIEGFLKVVEDPDKDTKVLILNGIKASAIEKFGNGTYCIPNGIKYSLEDFITFLNVAKDRKDTDDTYLTILARIDLANGVTTAKRAGRPPKTD